MKKPDGFPLGALATDAGESKKAPRPGAFLLPKPKPMRRITLLKQYNVGLSFKFHLMNEKKQKFHYRGSGCSFRTE